MALPLLHPPEPARIVHSWGHPSDFLTERAGGRPGQAALASWAAAITRLSNTPRAHHEKAGGMYGLEALAFGVAAKAMDGRFQGWGAIGDLLLPH